MTASKKKKKKFDAAEMKRKIQDEIYNETKNMSEEERSAYFRKSAEQGIFKELLGLICGERVLERAQAASGGLRTNQGSCGVNL